MKTAKEYLAEANAVVPRISSDVGIAKHDAGSSLFIDVRDSSDIAKSGTIAGASSSTVSLIFTSYLNCFLL